MSIKKTLLALFAASLFAVPAIAQVVPVGYVQVTGNYVGGETSPEANGTIYFQPVNNSGVAIGYRIGQGTGAVVTVATTSGVVSGCTVFSGGSGYTSGASAVVSTATGSGAVITLSTTAGVVTGCSVTAGGTGYTSVPSVTVVGYGQGTQATIQAQVTNGAFSVLIPDTAMTAPANVCYNVTVIDNLSGNSILGTGYNCVQPAGSGTAVTGNQAWCTATTSTSGGTCNFDAYTPNLAALAVTQTGPAGPAGAAGATGATGPPVTFLGAWSSSTAYTTGQAVSYNGSSYIALTNNTNVTPVAGATWGLLAQQGTAGAAGGITTINGSTGAATITGPGVTCSGLNCVVSTGVPTLSNAGQAAVYAPSGVAAGYPTAAAVTPDALAQPITAYTTEATPIASITDANAKTALTAINASVLQLQGALENAGIVIPNSLASTIASTSNAGFFLFNSSGASTCASTVTNQLATSYTFTQTVAAASGAPNFTPGGKGFGHPGYCVVGYCPTGPATVPSGTALPIGTTPAACGTSVTSTSQITSGASSVTSAIYPTYKAGSSSNLTLNGGGTVCWWGSMHTLWSTSGTSSLPIFNPSFIKQNEWEIGPGFAAIYNGSGYTSYTFTNTSDSVAAFVVTNGSADYRLAPENYYQMCLVYNGSTSATVYMNDGSTSQQVATFAVTALTATSSGYAQTPAGTDQFYHEGLLYLPGVQLTQAQVSGLYGGFNSEANHNQFGVGQNQGPAFQSSPENQWNTHTIQSSDTQDCPYFVQRANGGNSKTSYYNQTFSQCHVVFTSTAPIVRVGLDPGGLQMNPSYVNASIRVDGVLSSFVYEQSGAGTNYIEVNPATTGVSHTYDVNIGEVMGDTNSVYGNTPPFYTSSGLTDALGGMFLKNISVPNPYSVSIVPESGTVTVLVGDSILGSGAYVNPSSSDQFIDLERYNGGSVNNFNTANLASLSYGGVLISTDFNSYPTPATSGSVPTTAATAWVTSNVAPLAKGTSTNIANNVVTRGINDFLHLGGVYGTSSNCLAIFAFSLKNELAAMAAYNSSIHHYIFSPINEGSYAETSTDGCTGDSYTTVNALTVQEYSSGWSGTAVGSGHTFSGASQLYVYRAIEADICASTSNCTYVELGPGAPTLTGGFTVPTLSTTAGQCWTTATVCYGDSTLHLNGYGHYLLTRYINAESWATAITVAQRR